MPGERILSATGKPIFDRSGLVRIPGNTVGDDRNPIGREYRAGSFGVEPGFPGRQRGRERALRRQNIGLEGVRPRGWRFEKQLLVATVAYPMQETGHRGIRRFIGCDAALSEELMRPPRGVLAEP